MVLQSCNNRMLKYDEACLTVNNFQRSVIRLYNASLECYECAPQFFRTINPGPPQSFVFSTTHPTVFEIKGQNINYSTTFDFEQHGHYGLNVSRTVDYYVISPPDDAFRPLIEALIVLAVILLFWMVGCCTSWYSRIYTLFVRPTVIIRETSSDIGAARTPDSTPLIGVPIITNDAYKRNQSVDTFRGITIAMMLFVNYGGGKYWIFQHASWNGLTFADLVFPWFAWIMGLSSVLSISSQLRRIVPRSVIFKKVLLRSLALIAIGISLNSFNKNHVGNLRLPGVLQRLGLSYLIVGTLETVLLKSQILYPPTSRLRHVADVVSAWLQWIIMLAIVGLHNYITFGIDVPNCPKGYLGPGGLHDYKRAVNCTGGAAGYIDRSVFGSNHLYQHPTTAKVYHTTQPFDPEGLLGTLNMAFTVFLGANAGRILIYYSNNSNGPPFRWMILSAVFGSFALCLSNASQDGGIIPINKNLWSLSFVFATSSLAYFTLSILYTIIDYFQTWNGTPFVETGRNSILLYIGSEITKKSMPWNWGPLLLYDHTQILAMNIWSTALWIIIAVLLDNQRFYLKI